jgi:hypothetical protein
VIVLVTQQSRLERRETMAIRTGMRRETMWVRIFIVAFMVIAVTFALSAETLAQDIPINVKFKDKKGNVKMMRIKLDENYDFKEAKVDDEKVDLTPGQKKVDIDNPLELGEHTKKITEIRRGSVIAFEGSICIPIPNSNGGVDWLGYPPGTVCP